MKKTLTFFLLVIFSLSVKSQYQYSFSHHNPFISKENLIADIDSVMNDLEKWHPGLYRYVKPDILAEKITTLKKTLPDSLRRNEFCLRLMYALNCIQDGHMAAYSVEEDVLLQYGNPFYVLPLEQLNYKIINNRLYYLKRKEFSFSFPDAAEIVSINNIKAQIIIDSLKKFIFSDGGNDNFKVYNLENGALPALYHAVFQDKDSVLLKIRDEKRNKYNISINKRLTPNPNDSIIIEPRVFDYRNDYAYMKLGSFSEGDYNDYASFLNPLKDKKLKSIVIDLRNSLGGSTQSAAKLLSYFIKKPKQHYTHGTTPFVQNFFKPDSLFTKMIKQINKPILPDDSINFDGNVYVIINAGTFSASAFFASFLKSSANVTIIGQETGGSRCFSTSGQIATTTANNSKIYLNYGIISFDLLKNNFASCQGGVVPDINIKYTIEEYTNKKDKELEWILKKIVNN